MVTVYLLDKWENRYLQAFFSWVSAILLAYLIPAAISALSGQDYSGADIHQYSRSYFTPLAIVAVMSSLSIRQLRAIGWKPIAVFVSGSCWIALFPALAAFFLQDSLLITGVLIGEEYWKGIPPIVGSWIGGSTSRLVLKELVACPEHIFLTILVLDNILVNIWTILVFQGIKESNWLNTRPKITNLTMPPDPPERNAAVLHPVLCLGILLGAVLLTHWIPMPFVAQIVVLSVIGLMLSNLIETWNYEFVLKYLLGQ